MNFRVLLLFLISSTIFAEGTVDQPIAYMDLGTMYVSPTEKRYGLVSELSLPYLKPKGVNKVDTTDARVLKIKILIADGKIIKPKLLFLKEKNIVALNYCETNEEEETRFIKMRWRGESSTINGQRKLLNLSYQSETEKGYYKRQYIIPSAAKEIFLTYCVQIPIYTEDFYFVKFIYTKDQNVGWKIEWL
jgi:hypothetical protein